tara:strand:- start:107 stop:979 length:873 start_codon:yes stop_codon:yes gene_type:complete
MDDRLQGVGMSRETLSETVTALAELDAKGVTAEIFADIRQTMRIPALTSIWRTMAASEEDLVATWQAVKPLYSTGQPEAALIRLRTEANLPDLGSVDKDELASAGLANDDIATATNILASYNRSNSLNLLTQTALVSERHGTYIEIPAVEPQAEIGELPRLLPREEISDPVWDVILKVNKYGTTPEDTGLATIYRHLAYWPGLIEVMQDRLEQAQQVGSIPIGAVSVVEIALEEGSRMAHLLDETDVNAISDFARNKIADYVDGPFHVARIVNIGTALSRWLDTALSAAS